jgi:hypothetical protein
MKHLKELLIPIIVICIGAYLHEDSPDDVYPYREPRELRSIERVIFAVTLIFMYTVGYIFVQMKTKSKGTNTVACRCKCDCNSDKRK